MTIQILYEKISDCLKKLNTAAVLDDSVFDLEILVTQYRIRLHAGVYDPMKKLDYCQRLEVARLLQLTEQLGQGMVNDDARKVVVKEVAMITKTVLRAEGVPFHA